MCIWHTERDSERERQKDREKQQRDQNKSRCSEPRAKKKKKKAAKKYAGLLLLNVDLKNIHNLEVESYVLFGGNFLGLQTWETEFQVTLKELFWGGRGKSQVMQKFATRGK